MKGIILAGGKGTRLYPATHVISKQLLPVFDKPMVYYPLSTLMLAGIRDVLVITTPADHDAFQRLLGDGSQWGLSLKYAEQATPSGIAQALVIGRSFIGADSVALILGDNIFYGNGLRGMLQREVKNLRGATVFGYYVTDPQRYGVAELDAKGVVVSLEEKPALPRSNYAVTGLYLYENGVTRVASDVKPSARGELEITDVNRAYLKRGELRMSLLGRGMAWLDTGTHEALQSASAFIEMIEKRQGLKVACLEEIALRLGYINADQVRRLAEPLRGSAYGAYLERLLDTSPDYISSAESD
jgi:glucose-1-phosphate thymidylyltransferase